MNSEVVKKCESPHSHITIYIDDALADRLRKAADRDGMSLSSWVAQVIADRKSDSWPADILA